MVLNVVVVGLIFSLFLHLVEIQTLPKRDKEGPLNNNRLSKYPKELANDYFLLIVNFNFDMFCLI